MHPADAVRIEITRQIPVPVKNVRTAENAIHAVNVSVAMTRHAPVKNARAAENVMNAVADAVAVTKVAATESDAKYAVNATSAETVNASTAKNPVATVYCVRAAESVLNVESATVKIAMTRQTPIASARNVRNAMNASYAVNAYASHAMKTTATVEYVPSATDVTIPIVFYIHVYVVII